MLFGQHRGGYQHGHLFGFADGQKRRPQGHLGFPIAHVSAYQTVHGPGVAHVIELIFDGLELVRGLLVRKVSLEVGKLTVGSTIAMAVVDISLGIDLEQLTGDFFR